MNKLFIIHFYPLDYFPPVINLIKTLENEIDITVASTSKSNSLAEFKSDKTIIHRQIKENKSDGSLIILMKYILFCLCALLQLTYKKPDILLYYESISALPAYIYKRFINRKVKICVHYHEYMTICEYNRPGMRLSNFNHKLETSYIYRKADWISQTNNYRMDFFLKDYPIVSKEKCHIFPNYPPKSWHQIHKRHDGGVVKCVYIGSLSLKDTYVKEFCQWVDQQKGKVKFDIYSFNFHEDTLNLINSLHCPYINFHKEGVEYSNIPDLLKYYDVGVLLYKATSLNVKYCETNKFYEYLVSGLDVWYPKEMTLLHEMNKNISASTIIEMDISNRIYPKLDLSLRVVDNSCYNNFCEDVYNSFLINKQ